MMQQNKKILPENEQLRFNKKQSVHL